MFCGASGKRMWCHPCSHYHRIVSPSALFETIIQWLCLCACPEINRPLKQSRHNTSCTHCICLSITQDLFIRHLEVLSLSAACQRWEKTRRRGRKYSEKNGRKEKNATYRKSHSIDWKCDKDVDKWTNLSGTVSWKLGFIELDCMRLHRCECYCIHPLCI